MKITRLMLVLLLMGSFQLAYSTDPTSVVSIATRQEVNLVTLQTNFGPITIELDSKNTPNTAKNFLDYAKSGFYDGTIFHRVIDNFMIQGGGMLPGLKEKPTNHPIKNEADNGGKNVRGSVAMARTNDPHSASSQFFINLADNDFLNHKNKTRGGWGYCVFGKVVKGMDVVDKIRAVKTGSRAGHQNVPVKDVMIKHVGTL